MRSCKLIYLFVVLIFNGFLLGCKKVINVSLQNSGSQLVINGQINDKRGPYHVTISKSVDFTADNVFPPVSNALVVITGNGTTDTLSESQPGTYTTHLLQGKAGESYSLFVSVEGKNYSATSVMPQPVHLDSISFLEGRNNAIYAVANFQDPPQTSNYYELIEYVDGQRFKNGRGNFVLDDRLSNGRYIRPVLYDDSSDIKTGVTLNVQLICIDKAVYTYLNELLQISGNSGGFSSPTPTNPTSNISGGALGYFSANTISNKSVQIQ